MLQKTTAENTRTSNEQTCVQTAGKTKLEEHITEKRYTRQQRNNTRPTVEANSENGLTDTDTTSRKNVE